MKISLKSNISALKSQRMLGRGLADIEQTSRSLASGSRINRASDDAAGVSLSSKLLAKNKILSQSLLNLNDGVSVSNIMSSSLLELSSITTRIGELAEQSANGTFTDKQREALDSEAQALRDEYYRIANTTEFNGVKLFTDTDGQKIRLLVGNTTAAGALYLSMPNITGQTGTEDVTVTNTTTTTTGDGILNISNTKTSLSDFSLTQYELLLKGDFNNDGITDIMGQSTHIETGKSRIEVRVSDGVGGYTTSTVVDFAGNFQGTLAIGDLTNDGVLDMTVDGRVWTGDGDGSFTYLGVDFTQIAGVLADFNNDGNLDVARYDTPDGQIELKYGDGSGGFGATITTSAPGITWPSVNNKGVSSGDVNEDGLEDLLIVDNSVIGAEVFLNNGDGTFTRGQALSNGSALGQDGELVDLNGDGNLDMIQSGIFLTTIISSRSV